MRKLLFVLVLLAGACGDDDAGDTCEWNGKTYQDQEIFPAGDGCNSCQCGADGMKGHVSCSLIACQDAGVDGGADTCEWNGKTYQDQEIFPAGDGCNTCQCGADGMKGEVGCSLVACQDAGPEARRR